MNVNNTNINLSASYKEHSTQDIPAKKINQTKEDINFSKKELNSFVNELNKNPIVNRNLKFGFNEVSDIFYITIMDSQTNKVLKQYSRDEAINLAKKLDELSGVIFDESA